jgi:hypothetical protein
MYITDTEMNITRKDQQTCYKNTEFTGAVATLELLNAQTLY